jgi:hypothetical protein
VTERERSRGARDTRHEDEDRSPHNSPRRAVGPAKLTRSGASDVPRSPWCGKLTRAQSEDQVSPADALRYADWMLSAERGWAAVNRRANEDGAAPDLGALASAFAYLAEARPTQQLPDELALHLGESFGVEASLLRIHTDEAAAAAAALLHAQAFTVGADLYFAAGAYHPDSESGVELIAHEVAHVAQHQRGLVQGAAGEVSRPNDSHEHQADELARRFLLERKQGRYAKAAPATTARDDLWGGQAPRRVEAAMLRAPAAFAASGPAARAEESLAAAPVLRKPAPPSRKASDDDAPLETVMDLLGKSTFEPTPEVASHLEKAGAAGAAVRVKLGSLSPVAILRVQKRKGRYVTLEDQPQVVPLAHSLFVPAAGLVPVLRVQIGATHANAITGYVALDSAPGRASSLSQALGKSPEALGLAGFELPHLALENRLENGTLTVGTQKAMRFELGGWVQGQLSFGLVNETTTFEAIANVRARGLKDAELHLQRDAQGDVRGSAALSVDLGDKFAGAATASYDNGDVQIKGELSYRSEKFTGTLGLMVADVVQAEQLVRAQLDPSGVLPVAGVGSARSAGGASPPRLAKGRKGERGIAGWGELDFAFTDWLVGKALVAYGPSGHLTVLGKISPPKRLDLMKEPKRITQPILPQMNLEASYGIPHLADIHVGMGVSLNATAELGPIYMTDLALEGLYSTDPTVMNAFSITGDLHAQAHAGLALDVKGYAGLRVLKHSVNVGAGIQGEAGVRAYAEARSTLGYREVASPTAGKQGEYYLKGHLEMAAQPVLALGGRLFVELDSPWWSPAPDKTWEWPIGSLAYPLPTQLGVGADIDYVVGSGQWPDVKLTKPSFDPQKFVDTMMADRLPQKTGQAGDQAKQGAWQGVAPTKGPRMDKSIGDRGRGARMARREEGAYPSVRARRATKPAGMDRPRGRASYSFGGPKPGRPSQAAYSAAESSGASPSIHRLEWRAFAARLPE